MLWGESAGAASVDMYSFAVSTYQSRDIALTATNLQFSQYYNDPIVRAFAMDSGYAYIASSDDYAQDSWVTLASLLGCTGSETLACMRTVPAADIISALSSNDNFTTAFLPIPDNTTFYSNGTDRIVQGKFPTLVSENWDSVRDRLVLTPSSQL